MARSSPPKTRRTTGQAARLFLVRSSARGAAGSRRQASQYLPGGKLAIADGRHQVVGTPQAVVVGDLLLLLVVDILQRDAILARLFLDQLAADLNGALALVDVEPVLDLLAGAR